MVVKVYISGISGNKEVKKRQQRVLMILDSKNIKYELIDITEPGRETDKDFMQNNAKSSGGTVSDPNPRSPLPPQMFNDEEYCGDYDQFDLANEVDTLEQFLKLEVPPQEPEAISNGDVKKTEEVSDILEINDTMNKLLDNDEVAESANNEEQHPAEVASEETKSEKESSVDKDTAAERLKPDEENTQSEEVIAKEDTNLETKEASREHTPLNDEVNGVVGSREPSNEKDLNAVGMQEDPSAALIESEQLASVE